MVMKRELVLYLSTYIPTPTYSHEIWVVIESLRSTPHGGLSQARTSDILRELGVGPLLDCVKRKWVRCLIRMPPALEVFWARPIGKGRWSGPRTC